MLKARKILCVTNRNICNEDFLTRIDRIASFGLDGIILREKDLSISEYKVLASEVIKICGKHRMTCILHSFVDVALALDAKHIHLPLDLLRSLPDNIKIKFKIIGASCHSVEDALLAEKLGCTYITAGHIFETQCKIGVPGRGIDFLKKICNSVKIPVYAIGGIDPQNVAQVFDADASGICLMSSLMVKNNLEEYLNSFEVRNEH